VVRGWSTGKLRFSVVGSQFSVLSCGFSVVGSQLSVLSCPRLPALELKFNLPGFREKVERHDFFSKFV